MIIISTNNMKKIGAFLFLFFLLNNKLYAYDYQDKITNLQKQIDELKLKIYNQETKQTNLSNFIDGLKFSGRLHVNSSWYDADKSLSKLYKDKTEIKRAKFGFTKAIDNFEIKMDVNFDRDNTYLSDAYLKYNFNVNNSIKFGQITPPTFMEKEKSSNNMATIDSSIYSANGWFDSYIIGLNYVFIEENMGLTTGIFTKGSSNSNRTDNSSNYNILIRNYYTPIRNKDFILHIGYNFSYQDYTNNLNVNKQYIKNRYYYDLELAFQYKFININSEFVKLYYKYDDIRFDGNKFNFDGLMTELVINFTGESRKYNKSGYFGGIDVKHPLSKGGFGSFQGVFSYSIANGKDISGGYLNNIGSGYNYIFGINWIPENYFRILFNYSINSITKRDYTNAGKYNAFKIEARMYF